MKLYIVVMVDDGWSGKMATIKEIDTWDLWNTSNYDGIEFSRTPVSGIHKSRSDAEAYIDFMDGVRVEINNLTNCQ